MSKKIGTSSMPKDEKPFTGGYFRFKGADFAIPKAIISDPEPLDGFVFNDGTNTEKTLRQTGTGQGGAFSPTPESIEAMWYYVSREYETGSLADDEDIEKAKTVIYMYEQLVSAKIEIEKLKKEIEEKRKFTLALIRKNESLEDELEIAERDYRLLDDMYFDLKHEND